MNNESYTEDYVETILPKVAVKHQADFKLLLQSLKQLGYLNKPNPIIRIQSNNHYMDAFLDTTDFFITRNTLLFVVDFKDGLVSNLVSFGDNHVIRKVAQARWGNVDNYLESLHRKRGDEAGYNESSISLSEAIVLLEEINKFIADEIAKQGYTMNSAHVAELLYLSNITHRKDSKYPELAGNIADWIPYVCNGIKRDILLDILNSRNNPDYDKTGKLCISIDDYKSKLANIHPSFVKLLLQP